MASDPGQSAYVSPSTSSIHSVHSNSSQTPLTERPTTVERDKEQEQDESATYFLLDIKDDDETNLQRPDSRRSDVSSASSSSESAQVVIDHGSSLPRRLEKGFARHVFRSDNEESESDYAYSTYAHLTSDQNQEQREQPETKPRITRQSNIPDSEAVMAVYTEDEEDLMEQVPSWNNEERLLRQQQHEEQQQQEQQEEQHDARSAYDAEDEQLAHGESPASHDNNRKTKKRFHKVLQTNFHSHSWSRRESLQNMRRTGLSSDAALQ